MYIADLCILQGIVSSKLKSIIKSKVTTENGRPVKVVRGGVVRISFHEQKKNSYFTLQSWNKIRFSLHVSRFRL